MQSRMLVAMTWICVEFKQTRSKISQTWNQISFPNDRQGGQADIILFYNLFCSFPLLSLFLSMCVYIRKCIAILFLYLIYIFSFYARHQEGLSPPHPLTYCISIYVACLWYILCIIDILILSVHLYKPTNI